MSVIITSYLHNVYMHTLAVLARQYGLVNYNLIEIEYLFVDAGLVLSA